MTYKNVLEPEIKKDHKCEYCDDLVNNNDEYLKHLTDHHWNKFIKDCFNLEI